MKIKIAVIDFDRDYQGENKKNVTFTLSKFANNSISEMADQMRISKSHLVDIMIRANHKLFMEGKVNGKNRARKS